MRTRTTALAVLLLALAGCGASHTPAAHPRSAASGQPAAASPSASPSHYPDKRYGQTCKWGYGFTMSVLSAHRYTKPGVTAGEAWYTVTIRVGDEGDQPIGMPLDQFRPNALIGPHQYAAGEWMGDNVVRLAGTLMPGRTETGAFGYSVPAEESGPEVTVQWMFSDDTEPCTFVGRAT
jgi:hypothetical protein